ncbi:hypothetical protein AJ79_08601 [Helicocarpus griseus UAMH5409]|uniref:Arabinogalactan endo-beta-1,4-galactanase n=1 Tax=Helicocarpus griseus UAMH5409 TaxID=1447875 RepID=A0A2B7WRI4_9EURO|nr:hypothetical protein AJ79_08601 [Helicocarpus griseus UAMH5409]
MASIHRFSHIYLLLIVLLALLPIPTFAALPYKGADISSVLMLENQGRTFSDTSGTVKPFEQILAEAGANSIRQRVWVDPEDGNYNLDYNVELARRVSEAGMGVYLDLHYSDTWADPAHQTTPAAWSSYNIGDLKWAVYNYTLDVCNRFASENIPVSIISIGNEIRAGLLWPLGSADSYYNIADILHSASAGVKDSALSPQPQIMIHLDNAWNWDQQSYWYDTVLAQGPLIASDFDMMGVSYYPFYNEGATMQALEDTMTRMGEAYGKPILVVETDWPVACPNPTYQFPEDIKDIPFSVEGQRAFVKEVAAVVERVEYGQGLYYWEPGFLGNAGLGSSCEDNLMVSDDTGRAYESLLVFGGI